MTFLDLIIIIFMLIGLIVGYTGGFFKTSLDLFVLFLSMVIAALLKGVLGNMLSMVMPFINFNGIYSPNIIMYQLIVYVLIVVIIFILYQTIMRKVGFDDKIADKALTASIPTKIFGAIMGVALSIIFSYNLLLVLKFPLLNGSYIRGSYFSNVILERSLVSNLNGKLYNTCEDVTDILNENKKSNNKVKDTLVVDYYNETDFISYEKTDELREKGSLPEYEEEEVTDPTDTIIDEETKEVTTDE